MNTLTATVMKLLNAPLCRVTLHASAAEHSPCIPAAGLL
jgi:hypothetical protein